MGAGRFVCVALPLILTIASIVTLLYVTLAGVTHESVRLFRIDLRELSISPADAGDIAAKVLHVDVRDTAKTSNITAADLGLDNYYDVTLWGFCKSSGNGTKTCTEHQFNWADRYLNTTNLTSQAGVTVELPKEVRNAVKAFRVATKWAEVAFIAALLALAVEVLVGIFSGCSTIVSCITWLESAVATVLVFAAAGLSTALSLIVVGVVDSTAKWYGVHASVDTRLLSIVWISAALALGSSLFWILTVCCCKPDRRSKSRGFPGPGSDSEKLLSKGGFLGRKYEPLDGHSEMSGGKAHFPSGNARSDLAYEPYSHRA